MQSQEKNSEAITKVMAGKTIWKMSEGILIKSTEEIVEEVLEKVLEKYLEEH